jgi:putative ABC transport system permease protein
MWRVALKGITQRKRRFFSTMVAIVISVGFLTGVSVLSNTIRSAFDSLFSSVYGGTDVVVTSKGALDAGPRRSPRRLPRALVDDLRALEGVAAADGLVQAYTQVVDREGVPIGGSNAPTFGAAWQLDAVLNPFTIAEGRAPAAEGEIVVDLNSAKTGKLKLGDKVQVLTLSEPVNDTIVGFTRFGKADSPAGFGYTHFTASEADRLFRAKGGVDQILLAAEDGVTQEELAARVSTVVGQGEDVFTGAAATVKRQSEFKDNLKGFTLFLTVFALVAMFVATFVIFNTFQIILSQRQREMALLRALGASAWQLMRSVVLESAVIGLVASLIGLGVGYLVALGLKAALGAVGFPLARGSVSLDAVTVRNGFLAGILSTVVAALVPAWRASRVPPVAAMAETVLEHGRASRWRIALGVVLMGAAGVLVVSGLRTSGNPAVYRVGAAAGVSVFGLLMLNPVLLVPFTRTAGAPARLRGTAGQLAQENVLRSPRRNALTAFPLLFGAALVGLLLVFTASFKAQVFKTVEGQFKGDFFVNPKGTPLGFSPEVAKAVARVDGVEALTSVRFYFGDPKLSDDRGNSANDALIAVDTSSVLETVDIPVVSGDIASMRQGDIAVSSVAAEDNGWKVGDQLTLAIPPDKTAPLRIAAVIDAAKVIGLFQGASALVDTSTFDALDIGRLDQIVYVRTTDRDRTQIAVMKGRLTEALSGYATVEVGDLASYKKLVDEQVSPFVNFIIFLLAISVVIATIGVANTMKLSIAERTREIGVLRAVGMHRRQGRTMVRWEAITISVFGVVIGCALGAGFGVAIMRSLRSQGFTESVVPVRDFIVMGLLAAGLGLVAATGAARRVGRLDVLRAIAME